MFLVWRKIHEAIHIAPEKPPSFCEYMVKTHPKKVRQDNGECVEYDFTQSALPTDSGTLTTLEPLAWQRCGGKFSSAEKTKEALLQSYLFEDGSCCKPQKKLGSAPDAIGRKTSPKRLRHDTTAQLRSTRSES